MRINLSLFTNILHVCKTLHWTTSYYGFHEALDKAYEDFHEIFDKYVEVAIGIYGKKNIVLSHIESRLIADAELVSYIEQEFIEFNDQLSLITANFSHLKSLEDEIKCIENQLLYRLSMK